MQPLKTVRTAERQFLHVAFSCGISLRKKREPTCETVPVSAVSVVMNIYTVPQIEQVAIAHVVSTRKAINTGFVLFRPLWIFRFLETARL
jgi:hypothetical protein